MSGWVQVFNIDCRKIEAYKNAPEAAAEFISMHAKEGELLTINNLVLGTVTRTSVDGPTVRIYVQADPSIELGSAYVSGGN